MLPIRSAVVFGSDHPQPSFVAPLTSTLVPTVARGDATATFTRATAATVMGYAAGDNAGAAQSLLTVASGEARHQGARRVSEGVWSNVLADGSAIASSTLAGVLLEPARTNSIRNSTMQGAVAGTPGTLPTNWVATGASGNITSREIVGTGTENGIAYIDVRYVFSGAATANVRHESVGQIAATSTQTWTASAFVKLVGGSTSNITTNIVLTQYDGSFAGIEAATAEFAAQTSALGSSRPTNIKATNQATVASITSSVQVVASGAADITLRIGLPQLEQGAFATSPIPTSTVAVTRNADVLTYPLLHNLADASGSAYVEFAGTSYANSAGTLIGDGTNGPLAPSSANSGAKLLDGTNTVNGPTGTPSGTIKAASRWSNTSSRVVVNGTAGTVGSYDGSFGIADVTLGSGACGTLRNVMLWPLPASDATLIRLTTTVSIPDPLLLLESGSYLLLESGDKIKLE